MPPSYFLLSGERSLFKNNFDFEGKLANELARCPRLRANDSNVIELVLGLKSNGSIHLLLSAEDAFSLQSSWGRRANPSDYLEATEFESISPIQFQTKNELERKLRTLRPKKAGQSSPANRAYLVGGQDLYRATFEHGRLLYGVLNNSLNTAKYSVLDTSWTSKIRVCSFVFNVKSVDGRKTEDRDLNPDVLDLGFCEAHLPDLSPNTKTAVHVVNQQNSLLRRRKCEMQVFRYGNTNTETLANTTVQQFFQELEEGQSRKPVILLLCKENVTKNLLQNRGVDTSKWKSGLRDLFLPNIGPYLPSSQQSSRSHSAYTGRRRSSRSRSPERLSYNSSSSRGQSYSSSRYASASSASRESSGTSTPMPVPPPPPRSHYPPVYVVDLRQLYTKLMQTQMAYDDWTLDIGRALGLTTEDRWCAGNEAVLAIEIFRSMVSSASIDEQRDERIRSLQQRSARPAASGHLIKPEETTERNDLDSDEEDPNAAPVRSIAEQVANNHHDEDSDPDGFFGDSDSD